MAKRIKRLTVLLCSLAAAALLCAVPALAADYTYTVRIFAGNQGTFTGNDPSCITWEGCTFNETVMTWNDLQSQIQVGNDTRYFVRGVRLSGRDNDETGGLQGAITVTGDADYVVAYGIASNLVTYRVDYVDNAGNTIAPSQTYYGNVGEKPVVAYLYIDGYQPQALNITGTLVADKENVFTFVYTPLVVLADENITAFIPGDGGGGGGAGAGGAGAGAGGAGDGGDGGAVINDGNVPQADGPQEILDIDDEQSASGNLVLPGDDNSADRGSLLRMVGSWAVMGGSLLCLLLLLLFVRKRRKDEEDGSKPARG